MNIELSTRIYPPGGSDYWFHFSGARPGGELAVSAVFDTVGEPPPNRIRRLVAGLGRKVKKLVRDTSLATADEVADRLCAALTEENQSVFKLGQRLHEDIMGLCLVVTVVQGSRCICIWLGDCRAYLLRKREHATPSVQLLTYDHNELGDVLKQVNAYVVNGNEMLNMSRRLSIYWGSPHQEDFQQVLKDSRIEIEIRPEDVLVLLTDGIYLPVIREAMVAKKFQLTKRDFRLESWLEQWIGEQGSLKNGSSVEEMLRKLVDHAQDLTFSMRKYRDDIAVVGLRFSE